MSRKDENTGFICENCSRGVMPTTDGSYRNHCPFCLFSKHVDILPGDRNEKCGGLMQPVGLKYRSAKGLQIIHKCLICGEIKVNRVTESSIQPDNLNEIIRLSFY